MLLTTTNNLTMSSREIAGLVNTSHDSVLKTVRDYISRGVVSGNETPYRHEQNKQTYFEFKLCKRDALVVASGYSVELRARIIDRWQELESKDSVEPMAFLNDPAAMRSVLLSYTEKVLELQPKADALDLISNSTDSRCIRDTAKELKCRPSDLTKYLLDNKWIYRNSRDDEKAGKLMAYQHRIDQGVIKHTSVAVESGGQTRLCTNVAITGKGFARLALIFSKANA